MAALVTVAGVEFPEPSEYNGTTATIVNSGRNASGYVVGAVIRNDVANVDIVWKYLTKDQWAAVLAPFQNSFYNSVTFFNQTSGTWETRDMYVSDRKANMFRRDPNTGNVLGFLNCSLSLVEV